jgi:hypothetical protein
METSCRGVSATAVERRVPRTKNANIEFFICHLTVVLATPTDFSTIVPP